MVPSFQDTRPAPLQLQSGRSIDEFRVHHPDEVHALLRRLIDRNTLVQLAAPGGASYTTTLWTIDGGKRQLSLSADAAHPQVQSLVDVGEATAVAYLDAIKLQFDLEHLMLVHGSTGSALQARLPTALYRFQRRDSFRVRTPTNAAPTAHLRHPAMPDMPLALRVLDVSGGGCALALPEGVPALAAGITLAGVRIELDAETRFMASLSLQHVSVGFHPGSRGSRLGCAFVKLDGGAARILQRYIDQTQKRQRLFTPD